MDCVYCFEVSTSTGNFRGTCSLVGELFTSVYHVFDHEDVNSASMITVKISKSGTFEKGDVFSIRLRSSRGDVTNCPFNKQEDSIF